MNLHNPIRVMLVDDHRTVLWGLQRLIESQQPRMQVVGTATSAAEADGLLDNASPDVIVLDLDLGGLSGTDAIPALVSRSKARVLVLTGARDPAAHDKAVLAGACGVVTKMEPADTILRAIEKAHQGELWLDRAATGRLFLELSRRNSAADPARQRVQELTVRERQIAGEMARDAATSTREVARRLGISERTLRNHLSTIYQKLGLGGRLELWDFAQRHGLTAQDEV